MTLTLGLVGGIGSGKSSVAAEFQSLGALVINADQLAHAALRDADVRARLITHFGADLLDESGEIVRSRLGAIVFREGSQDQLKILEAEVHPWVRREVEQQHAAALASQVKMVVLDIPLLLESPHRDLCDVIVFVNSSLDNRQRRVLQRGWKSGDLERRENRQMPLHIKKEAADVIIQNDGTLAELRREVAAAVSLINTRDFGAHHG